MQWIFSHKNESLTLEDGTKIKAYSHVRNLENKLRKVTEVVHSSPSDGRDPFPYSPQVFPMGTWKITGAYPHPQTEPYLSPCFLATDAHQMVDEWGLNGAKAYDKKTGNRYQDAGYGLHFSSSSTTMGCIRIDLEKDLLFLVSKFQGLKPGEAATLVIGE